MAARQKQDEFMISQINLCQKEHLGAEFFIRRWKYTPQLTTGCKYLNGTQWIKKIIPVFSFPMFFTLDEGGFQQKSNT